MYNNDDIQEMIETAAANKKQFFDQLYAAGISSSDKLAIERAINEGYYEVFDRYDSAVCEHFIEIFETFQEG